MNEIDIIKQHYLANWHEFTEHLVKDGPICEVLPCLSVLEFAPSDTRNSWTYATCGMSGNDGQQGLVRQGLGQRRLGQQNLEQQNSSQQDLRQQGLELFILSPTRNAFLIQLLTAVAHYHASGNLLGEGHTVNFGCSWVEGSSCDHGLISLPYLDGPAMEWLESESLESGDKRIQFLWLIPITSDEVEYKKTHGLEALETLFEEASFNYIDPFRKSVVR